MTDSATCCGRWIQIHFVPMRWCFMPYLRALIGLLLLWLLGWVPVTHAEAVECTGPGNLTISNFGTITVPANTPAGTPVGNPRSVLAQFSCTKIQGGAQSVTFTATSLATLDASDNPAGGVITFQTSVTGIALQLTPINPSITSHTGSGFIAGSIPATPMPGSFQQSYSVQLVKTIPGAVTAGPLNSITLIGSFTAAANNDANISRLNASSVTLIAGTMIALGGCNILNVPVTLPAVFTSQLGSIGATAGTTPVQLNLTGCPASTAISISFSGTSATISGTPSSTVLASSGSAQNVGVQLLGNGGSPTPVDITGGVKTALGTTTSSGSLSATYYAQYYATGTAGPGNVNATAVYTLTYP